MMTNLTPEDRARMRELSADCHLNAVDEDDVALGDALVHALAALDERDKLLREVWKWRALYRIAPPLLDRIREAIGE